MQSQPCASFFYIDIFCVKQVWITYQSILHMKSGFYCIIASAKLQSQLVWMCVHVYLNNATGGSAARCIQSDLLLSGFWATALMRLHIDQSIFWSEFSIAYPLVTRAQGCSTCMTCLPEEGSA